MNHPQPPVPPIDEFTPERISELRAQLHGHDGGTLRWDELSWHKRLSGTLRAIERRDAVIAEMRSRLGAAATELQDRPDRLTPDHPGYDGTDAAHPAWWRGEKAGADGTAEALQRVAERGHAGTFGGAAVEAAAKAIVGIREELTAEREKVRVLREALSEIVISTEDQCAAAQARAALSVTAPKEET